MLVESQPTNLKILAMWCILRLKINHLEVADCIYISNIDILISYYYLYLNSQKL